MYLPLFINPDKHNRFPWQWKLAALLLLGWGFASELDSLSSEMALRNKCRRCVTFISAPEPRPVKYITVKTTGYGIPCDVTISSTHQMPLMELYDALRQVEDVAKTEVEIMPIDGKMSNAFIEQIYLRHEKEFMREYGLTLEQVAMIKREGQRIKKETEKQP